MPLDSRKVRILQAIVNDYVMTTKPVGSERLIEVYNLGVKSATVRNEMAEMAERGYLLQPHTSAGRIPTDQGYRYYVDELMDHADTLTPEEVQRAELSAQQTRSEIEEVILHTCRILSQLTSYPSLATDPCTGTTTLRHVYLTEASPRHLLLVLLLSTGHVEHRLVEVPEGAPVGASLTTLSNYLNALVEDHDLSEVADNLRTQELPHELLVYAPVLLRVFAALTQVASILSQRRVFLEGTSHFLRQPEFQDVQRLENLLNALEERSQLYRVLSQALRGCDATIIIGVENAYEPMQECSVVTTSYRIGTRTAGYLGVVGPTRMQYERATAAVTLMAHSLSNVLTNLSFA